MAEKIADQVKQRHLRNGQLISEFMESDVYKEIIGPDMDDMIGSIGSYKIGEFWTPGSVCVLKRTDDELRYLSGYQAGLLELSIKWKQYIRKAETEKEVAQKDITPMMEDMEVMNEGH